MMETVFSTYIGFLFRLNLHIGTLRSYSRDTVTKECRGKMLGTRPKEIPTSI